VSTEKNDVVETKELRLLDDEGRVRCKLFFDQGEPKLVMLDGRGGKRLGVGLLPSGDVGVSLYDDRERAHVTLIVSGAGTPFISITDRDGREMDISDQQPPPPKRGEDDLDLMPHVKNKGLRWLLKK